MTATRKTGGAEYTGSGKNPLRKKILASPSSM